LGFPPDGPEPLLMRVFSAKSFWLPVLAATLVAAFFGAILSRHGRYLEQMLVTEARQQRELARLTEQNEKARAERDALLSSPEAIERVAREEYGLAAPGEEVTPFEPLAAARPREAGAAMVPPASRWQKVLMWRHLSVALPGVVFLASAAIFAMWNGLAAARAEAAGAAGN
jgi:cell division protein FtsB